MIKTFQRISLTREQLEEIGCVTRYMKHLRAATPNRQLANQLGQLLKKWHKLKYLEVHEKKINYSVFEAIITDDRQFFRLKSVPELMYRLYKSIDKNYRVCICISLMMSIHDLKVVLQRIPMIF